MSHAGPLLALALLVPGGLGAANAVASYRFQDSLAADEPGLPPLVSVDPEGKNRFIDSTVFGQARRVFYFGGTGSPAVQQGGLTLQFPTSLVATNDYSAEMVFRFYDRVGGWRRILDVANRTSDGGFYVDPGNTLDIYPVAGSKATFVNNVYHHVVLTVAADGTIRSYLDGSPQFHIPSSKAMDVANPAGVLGLFLDNTAAGGQGEWSQGDIGLFRLYNGVLQPAEVAALAGLQGPPLAIAPGGQGVVVSWSVLSSEYQLQANSDFASAVGWAPVSQAPTPAGGRLQVTEPAVEPKRFYRLAKP